MSKPIKPTKPIKHIKPIKPIKSIIAILLALAFSLQLSLSAFASAQGEEPVILKLRLGSNMMNAHGENTKIEVPYKAGGIVFVPLRAVFEALGAEVDWKGKNTINVIYRDVDAVIRIGNRTYTANKVERSLKAAPRLMHKNTMVPLQFITDNFDVKAAVDGKSGIITLTLSDDGALKDLSFLTNGIGKPKAGNSYFGWSIDVPGGTVIKDRSFSSNYVLLENDSKGYDLAVSAAVNKDNEKLAAYYDEMMKKSKDFQGINIVSSSIVTAGGSQYAELLYTDEMDSPVIKRIYVGKKFIYSIVLSAYVESNPTKVKDDKFYSGILNSISLDYKGGEPDVQDLSKVQDGHVRYMNFTSFDIGGKYYTWYMDVSPDWNILQTQSTDPMNAKIGLDTGEYIDVKMDRAIETKTVEQYGAEMKTDYEKLLVPQLYEFKENKFSTVDGIKAYVQSYSIKINKKDFLFDEYLFINDGILYDVTLKCPAEKYDSCKDDYHQMINTMKLQKFDSKALLKDFEDYDGRNGGSRVGKDDKSAEYKNITYKWSVDMPGYWLRDNYSTDTVAYFMHPDSDITILVESLEVTSRSKELPDNEKFNMMAILVRMYDMKLKSSDTADIGGKTVKTYKYRLESDDYETYADADFYIFDNGKYSYCFMTLLQDIFATDSMKKELEGILSSFKYEPQ